ncbi:hypothetical protein PT974_09184 [Cladobotryum mycophilum]|uniref:C2H2-type domain-containing protein n=1 Tax=Cladobotryum mycophilum TaxID=491253 RepID=A0ABR0SFI6_9HYPO
MWLVQWTHLPLSNGSSFLRYGLEDHMNFGGLPVIDMLLFSLLSYEETIEHCKSGWIPLKRYKSLLMATPGVQSLSMHQSGTSLQFSKSCWGKMNLLSKFALRHPSNSPLRVWATAAGVRARAIASRKHECQNCDVALQSATALRKHLASKAYQEKLRLAAGSEAEAVSAATLRS